MVDLVHGYAVEKVEVVVSGSSVDIHARKEFGSGCDAREGLQRLDDIWGAEHCESLVECLGIHLFHACRPVSELPCISVSCDSGSGQRILHAFRLCTDLNSFLRTAYDDVCPVFCRPFKSGALEKLVHGFLQIQTGIRGFASLAEYVFKSGVIYEMDIESFFKFFQYITYPASFLGMGRKT